MLATIKEFGRIVACGAISTYNGETYGLKNSGQFVAKSLKLEGCALPSHFSSIRASTDFFTRAGSSSSSMT